MGGHMNLYAEFPTLAQAVAVQAIDDAECGLPITHTGKIGAPPHVTGYSLHYTSPVELESPAQTVYLVRPGLADAPGLTQGQIQRLANARAWDPNWVVPGHGGVPPGQAKKE